jgi:hypothetical protein
MKCIVTLIVLMLLLAGCANSGISLTPILTLTPPLVPGITRSGMKAGGKSKNETLI